MAIDSMTFRRPVHVGDLVSCHAEVIKVGRTSISVAVEAWATRANGVRDLVTQGTYTYVAIDEDRQPRVIGPAPCA